jgi:hypothetical protein
MNRLAPTVYIPSAFASRGAAEFPASPDAINGEQALLAPTPSIQGGDWEPIPADVAPTSVNAAYALLGRSSAPDPRRTTSPDESL